MQTDQEVTIRQAPMIDLDAPTSTYRFSVDVDMAPAGMDADQACGLFVVALETAYTIVRDVRINQCSALSKDGMHRRDCGGSTSEDAP
jgi:hypothetical protein